MEAEEIHEAGGKDYTIPCTTIVMIGQLLSLVD
jgi:hypothetical protein